MSESTLVVYQAHPLTGEYIGPTQADPDPLEDGNWLIPAMAFAEAPPVAEAGFAVVHVPGEAQVWSQVPDHRGLLYQIENGLPVEWRELGAIPEGLTDQPCPGPAYSWSGEAWEVDEVLQLSVLSSAERSWRDAEIERVKWLRERHRDEVDSARPTTLTARQSGELLDYVQALRDWPAASQFPDPEGRPIPPDWIAQQSQ
ncbi:hypothetical protein VRB50_12375 [Pseudomonas poae]|uniref:hypothetical protein n=1 Tax=Pseudomonas poae TaxID=200451 RepID=UPI0030D22CF6